MSVASIHLEAMEVNLANLFYSLTVSEPSI